MDLLLIHVPENFEETTFIKVLLLKAMQRAIPQSGMAFVGIYDLSFRGDFSYFRSLANTGVNIGFPNLSTNRWHLTKNA